jgi:hypothetical protein
VSELMQPAAPAFTALSERFLLGAFLEPDTPPARVLPAGNHVAHDSSSETIEHRAAASANSASAAKISGVAIHRPSSNAAATTLTE